MVFTPKILLFKSTGWVSSLIKWQTRSIYTHAAIQTGPGTLVESIQGCGVRERNIYDNDVYHTFDVPSCAPDQWALALRFARDQIGNRYDYLGVLRFITRRPDNGRDSWFCSELVYAAMLAGNVRLLGAYADCIEPWAVSPGLLSLSTLLVPSGGAKALPSMMGLPTLDTRIVDWRASNSATANRR